MRSFAIADLEEPAGEAFYARVRRLSDAGVDFILLRDKKLDDALRLRNAERCRDLIRPPAKFLVHGRADLALAARADGVHLPAAGVPAAAIRRIDPRLILGRSCHSLPDCAAAAREGLRYALLGPLFPPRSKPADARLGRGDLARAVTLGIDIYALGGISLASLDELKGIPIAGVAAVTLFMTDEPLEEIVEAVRNS